MISSLLGHLDIEAGSTALLLVAMHLFHMQVAGLSCLAVLLGRKVSEGMERRLLQSSLIDQTAKQKSVRRFRFRKRNLGAVFETTRGDTGTMSQSSSDSTQRAASPSRTPSVDIDDDSSCGSLGPYHPGIHGCPSSRTGSDDKMEEQDSTGSSRRPERAYSRFYRKVTASFLRSKNFSARNPLNSSSVKT
jgi:hypothetical protein